MIRGIDCTQMCKQTTTYEVKQLSVNSFLTEILIVFLLILILNKFRIIRLLLMLLLPLHSIRVFLLTN